MAIQNRIRAVLLLCALSVSPASIAGLFSDDEAHRKIAELQRQLSEARLQNAALEQRIAALENSMRGQGTELLSQVEALKNEVQRLNGLSETQAFNIEAAQKRQKDLYVDLDTRLRLIEKPVEPLASEPPPSMLTPSSIPIAPTKAGTKGKSTTQNEGKAYDAAFQLFKAGDYPAAIAAFNSFAQRYPGSSYAPNAYYWIGNSHYALRDYNASIAAQRKLLAAYPQSDKVPEALLNIASSQQEMGELNAARKTLEELAAKYPQTAAADLAKKRLSYLR